MGWIKKLITQDKSNLFKQVSSLCKCRNLHFYVFKGSEFTVKNYTLQKEHIDFDDVKDVEIYKVVETYCEEGIYLNNDFIIQSSDGSYVAFNVETLI